MKRTGQFAKLIELPLAELLLMDTATLPSSELKIYHRVLASYLQNDLVTLRSLLNEIERNVEKFDSTELWLATHLRLRVRTQEVTQKDIAYARELMSQWANENAWQGEIFFILARACETFGDFAQSAEHSAQAETHLERIGARHKALKARFNVVVHRSCIEKGTARQFIQEYREILDKANDLGDEATAGLALFNISHEYEIAGALSLALEHANRSLAFLDADYGTHHYALALLNRCHLLTLLGRTHEARLDDDVLASMDFPQIQEARKIFKWLTGEISATEINLENLPLMWRSRLLDSNRSNGEILAELECRVVAALEKGPLPKQELMNSLYGKNVEDEVLINRFKSVETRMRRKHPGLLQRNAGKYSLAAEIYTVSRVK